MSDNENDSGILEDIHNSLRDSLDPDQRDVIRSAMIVPCTSSEVMKRIPKFDKTIEIVGFVENVKKSKRVGSKNLLLFTFIVNNGDGERVQVTTWNEEVERTEAVVKNGMIIHLEGAYSRVPNPQFTNYGTINIELNIEKHTIINILGKRPTDVPSTVVSATESTAQIFELGKIGESTVYSQIDGFVKLNFVRMHEHGGREQSYGGGSITDGHFMLRIRIGNFNDEHDFVKGDHVRIKGYMRQSANPVFFHVHSLLEITKIDDEQMGFVKLLQGTHEVPTKREAGPQSNVFQSKRSKID